jgi:cellulose biosynthesis protein BcsQ
MSGKIISFFNHKGGVGKTTLVHNLGVILSDFGYKVLLIDADPQMNLTSAMYGLSDRIDYSHNENSKWNEYVTKYISFQEYLNIHLKDEKCDKNFFNWSNPQETVPLFENKKGILDMISGSINLSNIEADLFWYS